MNSSRFTWGIVISSVLIRTRLLIYITFLSIFCIALPLLLPLITQHFIDRVTNGHALASTYNCLLVFSAVVIAVSTPMVNLFNTALLSRLSSFIEKRFQVKILLSLFLSFRSSPFTYQSDLQGLFIKSRSIASFISGALPSLCISVLVSISCFALMFSYDQAIAVITLFISSASSFAIYATQSKIVGAVNAGYLSQSERQGFLSETLRGLRVIANQTMEFYVLRKWAAIVRRSTESSIALAYYGTYAPTISSISSGLVTIVIVVLGSYRITEGTISLGDLLAINILAMNISVPFSAAAALNRQFQEAKVAMHDLHRFFAEKGNVLTRGINPIAAPVSVTMEGVSLTYPGQDRPSLIDISLELPQTGLVAFVGKNGAGKSSLIKTIIGENTPTVGTVLYNGFPASYYSKISFRRSFGIVEQDSALFQGTLYDNLTVGLRDSPDEPTIMSALAFAGCSRILDRFQHGLDTVLEPEARNLSGGERQRFMIARAVLRNPSIAIFDEPTSSLDVETAMVIERKLEQWSKDRLVILVTHHLHAVKCAQLIVVLDQGKLVAQGNHAELIDSSELYRDMWADYTRETPL
ncbi:peptidase domain-containing ABC transporter [Ochrobactrum sp. BTU1]|uniref:peptidase domain-containing ABC transporter n=1 Tax=Ochrobactrum sp. BTU1 TaxID=2840456 RepID=UPI001C05AF1F|nr:ATP-binding cassette domain-containing protein [Ochrobactrum sp. BTU1]